MSEENGSVEGQPGGEGQPTQPAEWYAAEGMAPELVQQLGEVVKAKGWKGAPDALLSYVNLEKVFGADKAGRTILAPKGEDDVEGWNAVYSRLGRPEAPDGYKLNVEEGADASFLQGFTETFHAAGLTQRQVDALVQGWDARNKADAESYAAQTEQEYKDLRREWGQAADEREELARRVVTQYGKQAGLEEGDLAALEQAIGTSKMLKFFAEVGAAFAEGTFVDGGQAGGAMTPAQAQAAIAAKFGDQEFMGRYMNKDARIRQGAIDEMLQLQRIANPDLAA